MNLMLGKIRRKSIKKLMLTKDMIADCEIMFGIQGEPCCRSVEVPKEWKDDIVEYILHEMDGTDASANQETWTDYHKKSKDKWVYEVQ